MGDLYYVIAFGVNDLIHDIFEGAAVCLDLEYQKSPLWEYIRSPRFLKRLCIKIGYTLDQVFVNWIEYIDWLKWAFRRSLELSFLLCLMELLQGKTKISLQPEILSWGRFVEFPNRRRPPCTTMPWNILPSLVVLWGVYWMFYYSSSSAEHPYLDLEGVTWTDNSGLENTGMYV